MSKEFQIRSARTQDRADLADVIPLDTPYQLVLDSTNACNFKCKFCPTTDKDLLKKYDRPSGHMPFDLFCKIIDDCRVFNKKIKRIDFGKDGEPLLNKRFVDMVRYAKQANVFDMIAMATNTAFLDQDKIDALLDAGMDLFKISVEATTRTGYKDICGVDFDYDELIEKIGYLYKSKGSAKILAKIININLSEAEKEKFFKDFADKSDYIMVDNLSGWSMTHEKDFTLGINSNGFLDLEKFDKKEVCPAPFFTLSINFNGAVSICCNDWSMSTVVGDLNQESLVDLWNGERLFEFRKMHLTGNRAQNRACANCYARDGALDNIDDRAAEILEKLERRRPAGQD